MIRAIRANVRVVNPQDAYRPGVSLDRRVNDECSGAVLVYVFVAIMAFVMGLVVRSFI